MTGSAPAPGVLSALLAAHPVVAAPLADVTDHPFRVILRRFTPGLIFTEMVSAHALLYESDASWRMIRDVAEETPPVGIQLLGGEARAMGEAARRVAALGPAVIEINMGCPVRKVRKGGAGAALLADPARAAEIVRAVKGEAGRPVSVKMRLGVREDTALSMADALIGAGADGLAIHGRTAAQMYGGMAERGRVLELCRLLPVPILLSGDIYTAGDVLEVLRGGAAGVLVARGLMGRPWFLAEAIAAAQGRPAPPAPPLCDCLLDHLALVLARSGERGIPRFRQHLVAYLRGHAHAARWRRELLTATTERELREHVERLRAAERIE